MPPNRQPSPTRQPSPKAQPSPNTQPWFVAEVSSNHQSDLDRCLLFVDRAAEIGCQAVKFQLFRVDELFAPEILAASPLHRAREQWELPTAFLPAIADRCHERDIWFGCTPFSLRAVDELAPFVDFLKIASYELLYEPLLHHAAKQDKPLVLSTGMARADEVAHAVKLVDSAGCRDLTLLHCVSGYPAPANEANLAAIETLRRLGETILGRSCPVGWSDHSVQPGVIHRAVHRFNACMIEFHLDLDGQGEEFEAGHCWLPDAIAEVIREVRVGQGAEGDGHKGPAPCELPDLGWRADPADGWRPLRGTRQELRR
ncbi:MAG: N-acetylneuraminic acid synthase [bacterium]|nr:N-acetylneuraminic acid synthase [bacterium]